MSAVVADASLMVEVLSSNASRADRARAGLVAQVIAAPALMPFETANALRALTRRGELSEDAVAMAHAELLEYPIQLWSYALVAERAWELRSNATIYDVAYLALAELLDAPLLTLDQSLASVPGIRCDVRIP